MSFRYQRRYCGPLRAVILDWAGTIVDYGCIAPAGVFVEVFRRAGVAITMAEARGPMGAHKRTHIAEITQLPAVRARWQAAHGREPTEADIDRMYAAFIPLQLACLSDYSTLIPGTLELMQYCRNQQIKIGTTTGYDRAMTDININDAAQQGFTADVNVCASDVPQGRPFPYMALKCVIDLQIETVAACVKIDDTVPGIEEGLNAGMWSVGVALSGNEFGLSLAELQALAPAELARQRAAVYRRMYQAGAHYVIDSVADLLPVVADINARLALGEQP